MEGRGKFMPGQAYVAMCRVRTLDGLVFLGFDASHVRINPVVQREMDRLNNVPMVEQPMPHYQAQRNCLKVGFLNVRSYREHVDDMKMDPTIAAMDVHCFAETFLHEGQRLDTVQILKNGATCFRAERPLDHGVHRGGIMVQVPQQMTAQRSSTANTPLEHLAVSIRAHGRTFNIVTVYRPPTQSSRLFQDHLQHLLASMDTGNITVVLGDFNFDLLETPDHNILQLMSQHGFRQFVTRPTTDQGSLLDHVYVNQTVAVHVNVVDTYYSDHDLVCVSFSI